MQKKTKKNIFNLNKKNIMEKRNKNPDNHLTRKFNLIKKGARKIA